MTRNTAPHVLRYPILAMLAIACNGSDLANPRDAPVEATTDTPPDTLYSLTGQGTFNGGAMIVIAAIRHRDGSVTGELTFPMGLLGPVIELVPPTLTTSYWCVAAAPTNGNPGDQIVIRILDINPDQVAYWHAAGIDCATAPLPPFVALESGDFKTQVRALGR